MVIEWLRAEGTSANCSVAGVTRACAQYLASFTLAPSVELQASAARLASHHGHGRGRVQAAGALADPSVLSALRAVLPADMAATLQANFEWYSCRGAHFHNDAHYGGVLFGAWCLAGPAMDIVFPRTGWRVASRIGTAIVFDPFEPHGVLLPDSSTYEAERYVNAAPSVFLAFELRLTEAMCAAFGIGAAVPGAPVLSSERAVHAETGALS